MGQRLNIQIVTDEENVLANAYYHWSGYTCCSMELTKKIVDAIIGSKMPETNQKLYAIELLELTGALLTEDEKEYAKKNIEGFDSSNPLNHRVAVSRNEGLIAVSPEEISNTQRYEEARVDIDIVAQTISFGAIWNNENDEDDNEEAKYILDGDFDFCCIPFDKLDNIFEVIKSLVKQELYRFKFKGSDIIYSFIE